MKILQILPRVPPAVCGIGDYAWRLAQELRDAHDIHSTFLAAGTSWTQPEGQTEFPAHRLEARTAAGLAAFVQARGNEWDAVVLHLSPYGFQKRAVPFWLARGWRQLAQIPDRPRLLTMFHELYASGPVTSSAFWLQPLQKQVLRVVARASDALRTNRQAYADWLGGIHGLKAAEALALPVFSNFGEPEVLPPWEERDPAMAIFGWGIHSGEPLEAVTRKALACCQRLGLKRLHLIGGPGTAEPGVTGVEIVRHGFMEAAAMSRLLASSRAAYTAYHPRYFGKSTLVAAFAAHGLVLITQGTSPVLPDGLEHGRHVLHESLLDAAWNQERLPEIGRALRQWYDGHALAGTARSYAAQLDPAGQCLKARRHVVHASA